MPRIHKHKKTTSFDRLVYAASFLYPMTALPQIYKIFTTHSAHDLSLATWLFYGVFEAILTIYGVKNHLKPIVIQGILWLLVYGIIILGVMLYG